MEIFTTFKSKQCILAGSFTKNIEMHETHFYKLMDIPENVKSFSQLATVHDLNEEVKNQLISIGYEWFENPIQERTTEVSKTNIKKNNENILNPTGILKELTENEAYYLSDIVEDAAMFLECRASTYEEDGVIYEPDDTYEYEPTLTYLQEFEELMYVSVDKAVPVQKVKK